jgi:DNA (cytosine-5)-methyltransferase 1
MTHTEVLEQIYKEALNKTGEARHDFSGLNTSVKNNAEYIVSRSESNKAMLSVVVTLLTHKILFPAQDIRLHQKRIANGFAGRVYDTKHITPFMKKVSFPAMAESGWKTHSFSQAVPYDFHFTGEFSPPEAKEYFLAFVDQIQAQAANPSDILRYMFVLLIKQRDDLCVELAKPHNLPITDIVALLEKHFTADYKNTPGASRLPVLAIYAAYQCMMPQMERYRGKILCPLENHHSADMRSGRIGDIDINNADNSVFEGVEIKHGTVITKGLVTDAYEKFKVHGTDRYYLLTTANMGNANWSEINAEIRRVLQIHGCQVVVNGVYATLTYYLRLLEDPAEFIGRYVECIKIDETIKFQHKTAWNDIVSGN